MKPASTISSNSSSFRMFFLDLEVATDRIDGYIVSLSKMGVNNERDLRGFASIWNLEKVGMRGCDIQNIMQSLFADVKVVQNSASSYPYEERFLVDEEGMQSVPYSYQGRSTIAQAPPRLTKNAVIVFPGRVDTVIAFIFILYVTSKMTYLPARLQLTNCRHNHHYSC